MIDAAVFFLIFKRDRQAQEDILNEFVINITIMNNCVYTVRLLKRFEVSLGL